MFGQIIDLLVKQDDERRKISFLLLKLLFSGIITAKLYSNFYGNYDIISITDFNALSNFFIHGTAFICFTLFYLIWIIFYGLTSFFLTSCGMWFAAKIYHKIHYFINNQDQIVAEISKQEPLKKLVLSCFQFFNLVDIFEIDNNTVKPGRTFYKFYDFLLEVEDGKKIVGSEELTDTFALLIQFIVICNILGLHFLSVSIWLLIIISIVTFWLMIISFTAIIIAMLVDIKHSRLINLMDKLEPNYKKTGNAEQTSENIKENTV